MFISHWQKVILIAVAILIYPSGPVFAKHEVKPPITVKGFAHKFYPRAKMHMNICTAASSCGKASKVSYVLGRAQATPSFASYRALRQQIEAAYRKRGPKGAVFKFGKLSRKTLKGFTLFKAPLLTRFSNGSSRYRFTYTVYGKNIWISLISSSPDKKLAEGNGVVFLVGLLAWSQSLKK